MASTITAAEFKEALQKYPSIVKAKARAPKDGSFTIEELDKFRYVEAPASFSKKTGQTPTIQDIEKLVQWKLHHGTYRPSLQKMVSSNSSMTIKTATKDAYAHYASHPTEIKEVLNILTTPLKGVGPATGSLLLAIHDPDNVIFFSDEAFHFFNIGKGKKPTYSASEFEELTREAKKLQARLRVNPIDIEKVAYVIIKENEPVYIPAAKKEPSGLPRGRPKLPESEKKAAKKVTVPGRGRGRPPKANGVAKAAKPAAGATGKRGRSAKAEAGEEEEEDDKEEEDVATPPPSGKRKATDGGSAKRSAKKSKA